MVRWGNPRPISLLIGAGLTVFAYDFHLRAYRAQTYFPELVTEESAIWHAQARARRGAGLRLRLPDRTCFVHGQGDIDATSFTYLPAILCFCVVLHYIPFRIV
jgi:hypothetical protein